MRARWVFVAAMIAVLPPVAGRAQVSQDQVGSMAGGSVGLISVETGNVEDPVRFSLAFVGMPTFVDGAPASAPTVRIGSVSADGDETYETRTLPVTAFRLLGTSWYLDLDVPYVGTVTIRLDEVPGSQTAIRSRSVSTTGLDAGEPVEAVGHRHQALLIGDAAEATVTVLFHGASIELARAKAVVGDAGIILTGPGALCAGDGTVVPRICMGS